MYKAIFSLFISLFAFLQINAQNTNNRPRKAVFVIVDGIAPDMLDKSHIPNLKRISADGTFKKAYVGGEKGTYSESPTISAVGYNHVLTGVWTNKHNVWGNGIEEPNYNYPTIFRVFKNAEPNKKIAVFSTWEDNRTKLIGENLLATGNIRMDYHFDGYEKDTINFPHDDKAFYLKRIDSLVAHKAAETIAAQAPDLSWVYLENSDDIGHGYGDSQKLYDIISYEDKLVGKIYDAVKLREKKFNEDWLIIVTTDHGRTAVDGKDHGGQSDRERSTWIAMNKPGNQYLKSVPAVKAVDIFPTIAGFLNIPVEDKFKKELDGVGLINPVSAYNLTATLNGKLLNVNWKTIGKSSGTAEIFITDSNNFKKGGTDSYTSLGKVKLSTGKFSKQTALPQSAIYKVILKTGNSYLNTWIVNKN